MSTLLAAGNAQAAQEVANLAARDNRAPLLALLLTPALGWVAFNILSPALNQLKGMQNANVKRSAAVGLGLGAALLSSQSADAAEEIAQVRLHITPYHNFRCPSSLFAHCLAFVMKQRTSV